MILELLKKYPEGLIITEISKLLKLNRATVSKYVYGLEKSGKIKVRKIGRASVCYLNGEND